VGGSESWSASKGGSESKEPFKAATTRFDSTANPRARLNSPATELSDSAGSSAADSLDDDPDKRTGTSATESRLRPRASAAAEQSADRREGRSQGPRDAKAFNEKVVEAADNYAAADTVDKLFPGLTGDDQADSFPVTEAAGDIDKVSRSLQGAVTAALETPAVSIGLTPGEAAISAGIGTNLLLAPITGPLEQASTFLEIAGLVAGLAIGSHPLVLACIKPLLHTELEHALSQSIDAVVSGLLDAPQAGAHQLPPGALERLHVLIPSEETLPATHATESHQSFLLDRPWISSETHNKPRELTRDEPLWLCLVFVPKPPTRSTPATGAATLAQERDVPKPVVLPMGDDHFLRTLPEALRDGSVAEVGLPTATTMHDLLAGRHVILKMEGVSIAGLSTEMDSQAAYQHPGCLTGRCVPLDSPRCLCPCGVCHAARLQK
jgi:hypothetical protein